MKNGVIGRASTQVSIRGKKECKEKDKEIKKGLKDGSKIRI